MTANPQSGSPYSRPGMIPTGGMTVVTPAEDVIAVPVKPGWQTTEFWLTIVTNITSVAAMFSGILPAHYGILVMAVLNGAYAALRTLEKQPGITTIVEMKK